MTPSTNDNNPGPKPSVELSELGFEILRTAVRIAKDDGIQTSSRLRERLNAIYPEASQDIDAALKTWSQYTQSTKKRTDFYV